MLIARSSKPKKPHVFSMPRFLEQKEWRYNRPLQNGYEAVRWYPLV